MYHAEEHVAGLGIRLLDILFHGVGERFVAGLVALHNLSAALVDDDDMVVLVNYVHA